MNLDGAPVLDEAVLSELRASIGDDQEFMVEGTFKVEGEKFTFTIEDRMQTIKIKKISATELSTENEQGKTTDLTKQK